MSDSKTKIMELDQLENVTGGSEKETKELKAFIKKHDPNFKIYNNFDIMRWLNQKSGIGFESLYINEVNYYNEFRLTDGRTIYHEGLMAMLNERFGE